MQYHSFDVAEFYRMEATMKISSWRLILVVATAVCLIGYPKPASATTVNVTVAPNGAFVFSPPDVTIRPGDKVRWTWGDDFHSTTSGTPGMPNGLWNSGVLIQGAVFTHTFTTVGTFQYYCTPHGACCNMVGTVKVVSETPTPTPRPTATATPRPTATATPPDGHADTSSNGYSQQHQHSLVCSDP
jgi:plastocyanin